MTQKASPQQAQQNPTQQLIDAIKANKSLAEIEDLIQRNDTKDSFVNGTVKYGVTPLMYAADYGNFDVAQLLLDRGADVHPKNNDGWTSLMIAA